MEKPDTIKDLAQFWHKLDMDFLTLPEDPDVDFSPVHNAATQSPKHLYLFFIFSDFIFKMNCDYTLWTYDCFSREVDLCFNKKEEEVYYQEKRKSLQKKIKKNFYFKNYSIGFQDFPSFFYKTDSLNWFYRVFENQNKIKLEKFNFESPYEKFCEVFEDEIEKFFKLFKDLNQYLILNILEKDKKIEDPTIKFPFRKFDRNQIILLMDRLKMIQAIEDKPTTVQAKVISELTGFNYDNIRKSLSSLNKPQSKLTDKQRSDKQYVDDFIDKLG